MEGTNIQVESTSFTSPTIAELVKALCKAQGEFSHAKKTIDNEFLKSRYADMASVLDAVKAPLSSNGLAYFQTVDGEKNIVLTTTLAHSSGEWIRSRYPVVPVKNDPQSFGSALTYARRYCLLAILGVAAEEDDDDGNAGTGNKPGHKDAKQARAFDVELDRAQQEEMYLQASAKLEKAMTLEELSKTWIPYQKTIKKWDEDLQDSLIAKKDEKKKLLSNRPEPEQPVSP